MISNKIQKASDKYAEFLSSPIVKYKKRKVKVNDIFHLIQNDCEGRYVDIYVKLMSDDNNKLYFIDCDKTGEVKYDFKFSEYQPLNNFAVKELDSFMEGMMDMSI